MKKITSPLLIVLAVSTLIFSFGTPTQAASQAGTWKPVTPEGYTPITWAKAPGIATFFKAPNGNGSIDFLTRIYLPHNDIAFIAASSTPLDWGPANINFTPENVASIDTLTSTTDPNDPFISDVTTTVITGTSSVSYRNFAFARFVAETGKQFNQNAQFIWNGPFFNVTVSTTDLSLALKSTVGTTTLITSGSRPPNDMAKERRMLIINNHIGTGMIADFNESLFVSSTLGDQAIEGFAPTVVKIDTASPATGRLFIGISPDHKEMVIYCSQQATVNEASKALEMAGVLPENQLEADGGGSASCGYTLPGQFFVEPTRTLPLLMGAASILARGTASTDGLNVRSGPATTFSIVTKLSKGAPIRVFEEKKGWFRIGTGQWVLGTLIKKT